MIRRSALFGFVALIAAGCSTPGADLPPIADTPLSDYRLGTGDRIRLTVFADPRLSGEFRVNDSGEVAIPLVGSVKAAGSTVREFEGTVVGAMRRANLLRDPSAAVEVLAYRPIFVLGEAARPGQYEYQPGMNVLTAVALAGGFTYRAVTDSVSITRNTDGDIVESRATRSTPVLPGDVVTVFERRF